MGSRRTADLHVHTSASDGTLSPREVVHEALQSGLAGVGICDHDTVTGINDALLSGYELGIEVIPGVEINTDWKEDEIHIIGYFIDHKSSYLNAELRRLRVSREERARKIVNRLSDIGVVLSFERVQEIAGEGAIGRPHIAQAITEAGYAPTVSRAFAKFLARGKQAYVPREKLTPFQAVDIIHKSGGVAVFAHPALTRHERFIPTLVDYGLEGIEVFHSDHSITDVQRLLSIAAHFGLIVTGGSDSHGPNNIRTVKIGRVRVDISTVNRLRELAEKRKNKSKRNSRIFN